MSETIPSMNSSNPTDRFSRTFSGYQSGLLLNHPVGSRSSSGLSTVVSVSLKNSRSFSLLMKRKKSPHTLSFRMFFADGQKVRPNSRTEISTADRALLDKLVMLECLWCGL